MEKYRGPEKKKSSHVSPSRSPIGFCFFVVFFRLVLIAGSSPQKSLSARREQVPFSMAIGNGELMHDPSGIFLPGTELLQSPFRTEFSMGSRSRRYRRSLRRHRRFLRSCCQFLRSCRRSQRRSLRESLNIIKHC